MKKYRVTVSYVCSEEEVQRFLNNDTRVPPLEPEEAACMLMTDWLERWSDEGDYDVEEVEVE